MVTDTGIHFTFAILGGVSISGQVWRPSSSASWSPTVTGACPTQGLTWRRVCPEEKEASSCCRLRALASSRSTLTQWAAWGATPPKAGRHAKWASSRTWGGTRRGGTGAWGGTRRGGSRTWGGTRSQRGSR